MLLLTTVILYALAMLSYACDFAFRKERLLAPEAEATARLTSASAELVVPELVTAGAACRPAGAAGPAVRRAPAAGAACRRRREAVPGPASCPGPRAEPAAGRRGFWLRTAFGLTCSG